MADRFATDGSGGGSGGGGVGYYNGGSGSPRRRGGGETSSGAVSSGHAAHSFTEYAGHDPQQQSSSSFAGGAGASSGAGHGYYHHHLPPIHYITDQLLVTALPERKRGATTKNSSVQQQQRQSSATTHENNDDLVDVVATVDSDNIGMDLSDQEEEDQEVAYDDDDDDETLSSFHREESLSALALFLKDRHSFLVFSLADELPDESFVNAIDRQVVHLPWQAAGAPISEIPTVGTLLHICYALSAWLGDDNHDHDDHDTTGNENDDDDNSTTADDDNDDIDSESNQQRQRRRERDLVRQRRRRVAVITCANGRTRTALACACFLHFSGKVENGVRDGFCHFCVRTFSHHLYAGSGGGIGAAGGAAAAAVGGGGAGDNSNHNNNDNGNIIAAAACLETPLDVWKELPPSLLLLLHNFEQAIALQGYLQRKPLCLRAIALQGVPVEQKPFLDLWDGQGRHLYSSHDLASGNVNNNSSNNNINCSSSITSDNTATAAPSSLASSYWADEEGFFKVNVLVEGDFCLLCRFGGTTMQFQNSSSSSNNNNNNNNIIKDNDNDSTRILFRYANTTGFLSATPAALELPLSRVDVMRRYAPFFDPHDFLLSILWETDWTNPHHENTNNNNNSQSLLLRQESSPDVLTPIYKGTAARQEGWYLIWKHHVVGTYKPGWDDLVQDFISCDAKLSGQQHQHGPPPPHLVSLALCLANLDPVEARFLLLRGRLQSWWKNKRIKPTTNAIIFNEEEAKNDSLAAAPAASAPTDSNVGRRRSHENDKEAQTVLHVLDSVDVSDVVQDADLAMVQISTTVSWRHQQPQEQGEINLKQYRVDGEDDNNNNTDLPFESAVMNPNRGDVRNALLALPQRQAESAGSFNPMMTHNHPHAAAGGRNGGPPPNNSSLATSNRPQVPVLRRFKNVVGETATAEQLQLFLLASSASSSSSPLDDPENKAAVELLLQGLHHTGVTLHDLVDIGHQSQEWNLEDDERLTQQVATAASTPNDETTNVVEKSSVGVGQSPDSFSIQSNPNEARQCNDTTAKNESPENATQHMENGSASTPAAAGASSQGRKVENAAAETTIGNEGVSMKHDVRFEKYWKMQVVGLPQGAILNALVRDGKNASIWDDLDWDRNYEEQTTPLTTITELPMKQDSRFEKYWKMQGFGLPEGAIRNAIRRDGKVDSIWDLDWDRNYEEQIQPKESTGPPMKQDSRFEKYWKMKGVGLPEGAIRNAITRDGKDDSIWDLNWDLNYEEQTQPKKIACPPMKEDSRFEKYWKMKGVGLPEGAIRNAITRDGKDGSIWDLDWDTNYEEQAQPRKIAGPAMKEDSRFEKYWKMKCVGLPDGALRNAMLRDGLDGSILDLNWETNYETQTKKIVDDGTAIKDDPRFEKYWKMKLMGLPDGAIRNAMICDGADASVLDLDWEKSLVSQATQTKNDGVPLKDDPEYTKFFKMLDMGLTKDAVKNALEREGKDPAIMELDPNKSASTQKPSGGSLHRTSIIPPKRVRRKKIFWKPIDPGQIKEDSLWSLVRGRSMSLLKFDAQEFEELFTESTEPNEQKNKKKTTGKVKVKKAVQVIDGKRSMNGGIILLRLRMEYKKIACIVRNMDHGAFDATQLKALKDCLPSNEERQGLQRYMEMAKSDEAKRVAFSDLSECEKYMYTMIDVPNAQKKFDCMLFREQFHSRFNELVTSIRTLELACDEVKGSKSLREILGIILIVVNRINTGGIGNGAAGFSLEALLKLNEAKAFDKKTSVLHYLVKLVKRNDESLLEFQKDLGHVRAAQNIMLDNLLTEIKDLRQELEIVHKTAAEDADQLPPGEKRPISLKELKEQITLVRCIADVKHYNQTDHVTGRTPMERFAMNAATSTETAMTMTEDVKQKYYKVLDYFGEAHDMASNDFFGTMNRFLLEFSKAIEQVQKEEKALLRKLKNAASSPKKYMSPKGRAKDVVEKPFVRSALLTSGEIDVTGSVLLSKEQAGETISSLATFGPPLVSAGSDISTSTQVRESRPADMTINGARTDLGKKATSSTVFVDATAMESKNPVSKATENMVVAKKPRVWARSKSLTTQDRLGLAAAAAAVAMSKRGPGESDVVVVSHSSGSSMNLTSSNSSPKDTNLNGSNTFSQMNGSVDTEQSDGDGSRSSLHSGGIATAAALAAKKKELSKSIGQFQNSSLNKAKRVEAGAAPASLPKKFTSGDSTRPGTASQKHVRSASAEDQARLVSQEFPKGTAMGTVDTKGPAAFEASAKNAGPKGGFGISPVRRRDTDTGRQSEHGISVLAKNHQVRESWSSPTSGMKNLGSQASSEHAPSTKLGSQALQNTE